MTRLRDLGITVGTLPTGPENGITDVEGVLVGHSTIIAGEGPLEVGVGPIRTGVTVIMPSDGRIFHERLLGGGFVLNGAGELSGLMQVLEWGLIETPIALTNTLSVGTCSDALVEYMVEHHEGIGRDHDPIIPIVGECDDSWLNDTAGQHVGVGSLREAIGNATGGPVAEGNVGGGTGMVTCDLKGGIGTSSRLVRLGDRRFTVGVLVMSNFGTLEQLRVDGLPFGRHLAGIGWHPAAEQHALRTNYGSIIVVVGTDAPFTGLQLNRLARRAALGIGRCGSTANHGSGEIVMAFSTANGVPRDSGGYTYTIEAVSEQHVNPFYQAVIESTEEAILNALCAAETMVGRDGHMAPALPLDILQEYFGRWKACMSGA